MKRVKLILLATIVLASCSSTQSVPTTTTPPTTNPTPPTTVAPIDYGSDCKLGVARDRYITLWGGTAGSQARYDKDRNKSRSEMLEAHYALTDAYRDFRSFIRNLDIPFASAQQRKFVDAIQDYVDALNRYLESDGKDLSVNDYLIPLSDAESDFNNAFLGTCQR